MKKIISMIVLLAAAVWLAAGSVVCSFAADFPEPQTGFFVNDFADVIDAGTEDELMSIGASLYKQTTAQVAVVTVDTIGDYSVEEYALELGRSWGVGSEEGDNGVVILLAVSERQVTIQVGYGLEGCLPDGKTGRILDEFAVPYLSEDDFSTGLAEAYKAVVTVIYEEYGVTPEIEYGAENYAQGSQSDYLGMAAPVIIILILILLFGGGRRRGRHIFIGPFFGGGFHGGSFRGGGGGFSGGGGSFGGGGASRGF